MFRNFRLGVVGVFLVITCVEAQAFAATQTAQVSILSYREVQSLTAKKREQYMERMRRVLELFAKIQVRAEASGDVALMDEMQEQIALLRKHLSLIPEAEAVDLPVGEIIPVCETPDNCHCSNDFLAVWSKEAKTCILVNKSNLLENQLWKASNLHRPGTCPKDSFEIPHPYNLGRVRGFGGTDYMPGHDRYAVACVPRASIQKLSTEQRNALMFTDPAAAGVDGAANAIEVAASATDPAVPANAVAVDPAVGEKADIQACQPEPLECLGLRSKPKKELDAIKKAFRTVRTAEANICISGGNFTQYKSKDKKPGSCTTVRNSPHFWDSSKVQDKDAKKAMCGTDETLCNEGLYCLRREPEIEKVTKLFTDGKGAKPNGFPHCEKNMVKKEGAPRAEWFNVTQRCGDWYRKTIGQKTCIRTVKSKGLKGERGDLVQYIDGKEDGCDPQTTNPAATAVPCNLPEGIWREFREQTVSLYNQWCRNVSADTKDEDKARRRGFQLLNCAECVEIGRQIALAQLEATGKCAIPAKQQSNEREKGGTAAQPEGRQF